ncbi:MAG: dTDP-4-dehydrorhamnose reductase [Phycisphaerae bacterium]|jgi:dTDP-4-dehydrorhamnose reductase
MSGGGKIAILGGRGMLGSDLIKIYNDNATVFDQPDFDITNYEQLRSVVESHETIINCAAYTNVDGAESQREFAHKINADAAGRLGELAGEKNKYVLHISTDFVFDGKLDRPYVETDEPNPINEYGRSKLAGERALIESGCHYCILRLEWTFGLNGNNFVKKLLQLANEKDRLKVVTDQLGSPTATKEAAKAIHKLESEQVEGIFHFAAAGYASRFEIAKFIFDNKSVNVELEPCTSEEFKRPAKRPLNSRFCCDKIAAVLDGPIGPWQGPLKEFLEKI